MHKIRAKHIKHAFVNNQYDVTHNIINFFINNKLYIYWCLYYQIEGDIRVLLDVYYTLEDLKRRFWRQKINQQGCNGESPAFGRLSLCLRNRGITPNFAGLKHAGLSSPLYWLRSNPNMFFEALMSLIVKHIWINFLHFTHLNI